ncbi:MAG: molybdate ABC transporter permease subunit [Hydrogenophaga sp.]|uniref:molybdate ABC transporter permease subunit n=1 Tax=Hydrogenophaga sp. TaxID=1904254 RepID=UPI001DFB266C|nr:molybdate ABC transporter permease subunit [Hydrogenophaga sp.]MBX3611349.1 molybdate ABC transporter permease subunit [Hydrogenophaga sp.]
MLLTPSDLQALALTLRVAGLTTLLLLVIGVPLAWWLARTRSAWRHPVGALVTIPFVLPPSVLGFYLLVAMGPNGPVGQWTQAMGLGLLTFSFGGLVAASLLYSLPFMVQPVLAAMQQLGDRPLEAAASLRASQVDRFFTVVLPLCRPALITGTVMSFAHTVGEFGVVLMVGGNIPGVTRVVSLQIYDHVEALEYGDAHRLAAVMLVFAFAALLSLQWVNRRNHRA